MGAGILRARFLQERLVVRIDKKAIEAATNVKMIGNRIGSNRFCCSYYNVFLGQLHTVQKQI
jgi:hypothetical protein